MLAFSGTLRIEYMYVVSFLVGSLTVLFQLAYQVYLPSLVEQEQLVEGNSKLAASASVAEVGRPGLAGMIIGWLTAPIAILFDAVTFLISALSLAMIRKPEKKPVRSDRHENLWRQIGEGFRLVFASLLLRAILAQAATYNLFNIA